MLFFTRAFNNSFSVTHFGSRHNFILRLGPYYQSQQVLGITFSSLEELPTFGLPTGVSYPDSPGILPGSLFSPFERFAEGVQLTFTFDPVKREELRLDFAQERLAEAKALTEQGQFQQASNAAFLYQETMATASQNLQNLASTNPSSATQLISSLEEVAASHTAIVQSIAATAPPASASAWIQITDSVEKALDQVADLKGEPPIPDELSTNIQSLKEQGLLTSEETEKIYGLESRAQVRDTLERLTTSGRFPIAETNKLNTAIASHYPDFYDQYANNLYFAELRSYETLAPPSDEIKKSLEDWQKRPNKDLPPPPEIRPYLYTFRAEKLAQDVNLSNFSQEQKDEVVKFFPEGASENPTAPLPAPKALATPAPTPSPEQTEQAEATPLPSPSPVPAATYLTEYNGALPGNPFYFVKKVGEGLQTALTFDQTDRARLKMNFAEERLREAAAIAGNESYASQYQQSLEQYRDTMQSVGEALKNYSGPLDQKQELARVFETEASRHNVVFEKGLLPVPPKNTEVYTQVIQATENLMDSSSDTLGRAPLPPALSDRLQDLKAQGIILSEEVNAISQSASREEVREKVRGLVELGSFPAADAKKLDETQAVSSPQEYNQLVEVRKIEELQRLRAVQSEFAQTATLRQTKSSYEQRIQALENTIDPTFIKPEDLGGRADLLKTYEQLAAIPRPINSGQFGTEATPGAQVAINPTRQDAVLTACPKGAVFKQFEGCVWADSGKSLGDFEQYRCEGPRQYYSFAAKKCLAYDISQGWSSEDAQPICPLGYNWSWQTQSCQTSRGGTLPFPSPSPQPEPINDKEREERAKNCPQGSSYKPPNGCVWDNNGKSVYEVSQYRCSRGQYYSFDQQGCVANPQEGQPYPRDAAPSCPEANTYWNWSAGRCIPEPSVQTQLGPPARIIDEPRPFFVTYDSPFYFLKQAGERIQQTFAFTPEARGQVSINQAEERLAEAADALKKNDEEGFKKSLASYTSTMQLLVGDLSKESLTEQAKKQIGDRLSEGAVEQNLLLQKLSAWASQDQESAVSAAVSVSILGVDKAKDIKGEPPLPPELTDKIEALPKEMISEEDKKKLLEIDSRVEARLLLGGLTANGALTQTDVAFLREDFDNVDQGAKIKVEELQKLEEITNATENKGKLEEQIGKNEEIVQKLQEFEKTFEPGNEIPAEIRPYVRLTRLNEIAGTIRPDIINLDDFGNRRDVQLAVATLREEFKPTRESFQQVEQYRRNNPGRPLPFDLARIEALSFGLGVRDSASACFLPSPPFAPNTPCPSPGAAIPVSSYNVRAIIADEFRPGWPGYAGGGNYGGNYSNSYSYTQLAQVRVILHTVLTTRPPGPLRLLTAILMTPTL